MTRSDLRPILKTYFSSARACIKTLAKMSGMFKKLFGEGVSFLSPPGAPNGSPQQVEAHMLTLSLAQQPGIKNVITLFHSPNSPSSIRIHSFLKQANAQTIAHATEDQASDHSQQNKAEKNEFELEVTEADPTADQLRSMLEFSGAPNIGHVVEGATSVGDAVGKMSKFQRPVVRVVVAFDVGERPGVLTLALTTGG